MYKQQQLIEVELQIHASHNCTHAPFNFIETLSLSWNRISFYILSFLLLIQSIGPFGVLQMINIQHLLLHISDASQR